MTAPRIPRHSPAADSGRARLDRLTMGMRSTLGKVKGRRAKLLNGRSRSEPPRKITLATVRFLEPEK